jgi:hypothetical protein
MGGLGLRGHDSLPSVTLANRRPGRLAEGFSPVLERAHSRGWTLGLRHGRIVTSLNLGVEVGHNYRAVESVLFI